MVKVLKKVKFIKKMDNMFGEIKDIIKENTYYSYYLQVEIIVVARWEKMTIQLHCLGFASTLRFYDKLYFENLPIDMRNNCYEGNL